MRKRQRSFHLTVIDRTKKVFSIHGPMSRSADWRDRVIQAQESGREVTCSASDGPLDEQQFSKRIQELEAQGLRYCSDAVTGE